MEGASSKRRSCLVVDGNTFYNYIEGFVFEEGYVQKIRVEKVQTYRREKLPADAYLYHYKLIEVLSKTKQKSDAMNK